MTDQKVVTIEEVAQQMSDPKRFKKDLRNLVASLGAFTLTYGKLGVWAMLQVFDQTFSNSPKGPHDQTPPETAK